MTIRYTCTNCGVVLKIRDEKAGSAAKCPKCGTEFVVPHLGDAADSDVVIGSASASDPSASPPATVAPLPADEPVAPGQGSKKRVSRKPDSGKPVAGMPDAEDDDDVAEKYLFSEAGEEESSFEPDDESQLAGDGDIDEPVELTPDAPPDDFNPLDVLSARASAGAASSAPDTGTEKKVSVADMMRDFNASKKKRAARRKGTAEAEPAEVVATSGSAADALARAYQQKREAASAPKVRRPTRADAERTLMYAWLKRSVPAVAGALLFGYGLFFLITFQGYSGTPLAAVTGVLTQENQPLKHFKINLVPILTEEENRAAADGKDVPGKSTAFGFTDEKGEFYMRYTAEVDGAPIGESRVEIYNPSGVPVAVPKSFSTVTVKAGEPNTLVISL